ncbi:MAG: alpha-galactosidase [Ruminococcaceae bacterium]|nr:alpha-galactosidase [Oscillospiraceae bacterium]
MSITITTLKESKITKQVVIRTKNTMYVLGIFADRFPVHLYYGKKSRSADTGYHPFERAFSPYYPECGWDYMPNTVESEYPYFGMGDFRASAIRVRDLSTGSDVTEFTFRKMKKYKGRVAIQAPIYGELPYAEADEDTETLEMILDDTVTGCELHLFYTVFPESDVIARHMTLINKGKNTVSLEKCMSLCLDIKRDNLDLISTYGGHGRERMVDRHTVSYGVHRITSRRGASSHMENPCIILCDPKASEERGEAYGFNFVYSGDFLDELEIDQTGKTRVLVGLGDETFSWRLEAGESFTSPEAVMTYAPNGIGEVSRNFHRFTRKHILPPEPFERRPVVLNSWEAFYFNIDGKLMEDFSAGAAEVGMDLPVMDDGWFGARRHDRAGLGDWVATPELFPDGLAAFVERVKAKGDKFGIWIEPEMVNPDSDLYRAHPEWALSAPGRVPLESRNQLVLDMGNPAVVDYLSDILGKTFNGIPFDYFKWDMNRHLTGVYSNILPPERQKEASFRHMCGVYELFRRLRAMFPNAMIENCSGGGGRYDLGMMKYSTQIWTSDNTEPVDRTYIQYGSTLGYPVTTMSCHVANHDSSIEDPRKLNYGFRVAINGPLGYELNILAASETAKATMSEQIKEYRAYEHLILRGDFYRLLSPFECGRYSYYFVSEDSREILLSYLQNFDDAKKTVYKLKISRALPGVTYRDTISGKTYTGEELRRGIEVESDEKGLYAVMWHLVAEA